MIMAIIRLLDRAFPAPTGAPGPTRRIANNALTVTALVLILVTIDAMVSAFIR